MIETSGQTKVMMNLKVEIDAATFSVESARVDGVKLKLRLKVVDKRIVCYDGFNYITT